MPRHPFEKLVYDLMKAANYFIQEEKLIGSKKVDLYFEYPHFGTNRRCAVECKAWHSRLDKGDLSEIFNQYSGLLESKKIDELLIVTQNGLSAAAQTLIEEKQFIFHQTYAELENTVIDFPPYLRGLINQYEEKGLPQYYIPIRSEETEDLENHVRNWVMGSNDTPLAILGSYGMGKTTFAQHMAHFFSKQALEDTAARIPILLSLSEIATDQSLKGLLGKTFTATSPVKNFSYAAFMNLNNAGRFIIFLDGFDEMKHTLSWEEFIHNFNELNQLVKPNSRVILLGRPDAFLSDDERTGILEALRSTKGRSYKIPNTPTYKQINLLPFSQDKVRLFLQGYLAYLESLEKTPAKTQSLQERFDGQISQLSTEQWTDLSRRPVHLEMMAQILPNWTEPLASLNTTILYSAFIDHIILREQSRVSRSPLSQRQRRQFVTELAFWLWKSKTVNNFRPEELPDDLITPYRGTEEDLEDVKRDLLCACFLETKQGLGFYFPHRSFQEFLVAEKIRKNLMENKISLPEASKYITEGVSEFLGGICTHDDLMKIHSLLVPYTGSISWSVGKLLFSDNDVAKFIYIQFQTTKNLWHPLLLSSAVWYSDIDLKLFFPKSSYSADNPHRLKEELMLEIEKRIETIISEIDKVVNLNLTDTYPPPEISQLIVMLLCLMMLATVSAKFSTADKAFSRVKSIFTQIEKSGGSSYWVRQKTKHKSFLKALDTYSKIKDQTDLVRFIQPIGESIKDVCLIKEIFDQTPGGFNAHELSKGVL